ncbi:ATP-dependent protease La [Plesiocystis pacifica SIR-1]|uniref:Lon protease n=1 Tax=Plesiocystis pacifica SIR-1 TaxID=391625 RepID=A6G0R1_9BACT|nr:endopeptidase La [Plesiocystis pacifica]EDM80449.1 ATP-dependent protease La [Plesiocystis pacifica SIR-1]
MSDKQTQVYPLLPLRRGILYPGSVSTLPVGRKRSLALVEAARAGDTIVIASQHDPSTERPALADIQPVAVLAKIHRIGRNKAGNARLVVETLERVKIDALETSDPYLQARVHATPDENAQSTEAKILAESLREHIRELAGEAGGGLVEAVSKDMRPSEFADAVASNLPLTREAGFEVLVTVDVPERLRLVARYVNEARETQEMRQKIDEEVRKRLGKQQRDHILRERMKAIQSELGDGNGEDEDEVAKLRAKFEGIELPEEAAKVVERELKRLTKLNPAHPEFNVARTYLETLSELPWDTRAEAVDDLDAVAKQLDDDHYGLDEVKERILEHMAVLKLSKGSKGTILCLAGPPGVGKTSLGRSIAEATNRPFVRIALGGVRDEAEIRGHRRTYIGALPGRIINAVRKSGVKNPVMLLDEVDKLSQGFSGSPEAALLELLDPEQNDTFTDHYLELPFDMSEVMFVVTANDLSRMSAPLRDRLEIVQLSGYTPEEKLEIARDHLLPRQLDENALEPGTMLLEDEALRQVITDYTREAGVRQLGREIGRLARAVALKVARRSPEAEADAEAIHIEAEELEDYLGKRRFFNEVAERTAVPGVATGLAWTPVGGDILFIETSQMPGKGALQITGQLGDVMKESARAALTYVRSNAESLEVDPNFLDGRDVHIHVPAGAVPKDGPSAGVTIFTALTSLLTGRRVRSDTAMTGECTLRGRVLPVGGIKAKVLAAHRAGITRVILPHRNARDVDDVPEEVRSTMEFVFAEDMQTVLEAALETSTEAELGADQSLTSLGIVDHGAGGSVPLS